jgi:flagellar biosynthesis/type III secretory pathway M-ring protein FliF/YscJ
VPEVPILAHGGAVGAAFEGAFLVIPIIVFAFLSRVARQRREAEEAAEAEEAEDGEPESTPS